MLTSDLAGARRFVRHPVADGFAEGHNRTIMSITPKTSGFRNARHFTTAMCCHRGGPDLYPTLIPEGRQL